MSSEPIDLNMRVGEQLTIAPALGKNEEGQYCCDIKDMKRKDNITFKTISCPGKLGIRTKKWNDTILTCTKSDAGLDGSMQK